MKQVYEIRTYKQYDRDVKLAVHRGLDIETTSTDAEELEPIIKKALNIE